MSGTMPSSLSDRVSFWNGRLHTVIPGSGQRRTSTVYRSIGQLPAPVGGPLYDGLQQDLTLSLSKIWAAAADWRQGHGNIRIECLELHNFFSASMTHRPLPASSAGQGNAVLVISPSAEMQVPMCACAWTNVGQQNGMMVVLMMVIVAASAQNWSGVYEAEGECRAGCCCPAGPITVESGPDNDEFIIRGEVAGGPSCMGRNSLEAAFSPVDHDTAIYTVQVPPVGDVTVTAEWSDDGDTIRISNSVMPNCETVGHRDSRSSSASSSFAPRPSSSSRRGPPNPPPISYETIEAMTSVMGAFGGFVSAARSVPAPATFSRSTFSSAAPRTSVPAPATFSRPAFSSPSAPPRTSFKFPTMPRRAL